MESGPRELRRIGARYGRCMQWPAFIRGPLHHAVIGVDVGSVHHPQETSVLTNAGLWFGPGLGGRGMMEDRRTMREVNTPSVSGLEIYKVSQLPGRLEGERCDECSSASRLHFWQLS